MDFKTAIKDVNELKLDTPERVMRKVDDAIITAQVALVEWRKELNR